MAVNYEIHESDSAPIVETRDRFVWSAMWSNSPEHCAAVSAAFDRLAVMLPGAALSVTMFQNSPSGQRTEYALVMHTGKRADQRRYFRPGAVVAEYGWTVKRGSRIPYTHVIERLDDMAVLAENA